MIDPDPDRRNPGSFPPSAWVPAVAAAALMVTIGGLTAWLALKFDALHPRVGDIVEFTGIPPDLDTWQLSVATAAVMGRSAAAGPCIFDPIEMSAQGGSLLIEAREGTSPPLFHLHWAGRHTAKGEGDCGPSADLTLDRTDLRRLANAAGGFGVRPRMN